jgi:hypothetical protein
MQEKDGDKSCMTDTGRYKHDPVITGTGTAERAAAGRMR